MQEMLQGQEEMLNFHPPVAWFVDENGKVWVEAEAVFRLVSSMAGDQKAFAKSQCKQMAAQASYDVGKAEGLDIIRGLLARMLNAVAEKVAAATSTCESASGQAPAPSASDRNHNSLSIK